MARLFLDLRFAVRNLARSPVFTAVAVASLALGIGANTAIFTLVDQLLLRLLPVRDPQQLVMIWTTGPHMGNNRGDRMASYPMYQDFQQRGQAFSAVFCRYEADTSISFSGQTERAMAELVSGNYFQALGVGPALGRVFTPEQDDRVYEGHPSVVLSYLYWITRFGARPHRDRPQDPGQQLPHDHRGCFGGQFHGHRSVARPAAPHPHPDEAAADARLGRYGRPAQPVGAGVRAHEDRVSR